MAWVALGPEPPSELPLPPALPLLWSFPFELELLTDCGLRVPRFAICACIAALMSSAALE